MTNSNDQINPSKMLSTVENMTEKESLRGSSQWQFLQYHATRLVIVYTVWLKDCSILQEWHCMFDQWLSWCVYCTSIYSILDLDSSMTWVLCIGKKGRKYNIIIIYSRYYVDVCIPHIVEMMAAAWTKNNECVKSSIIQTTSDSHRSHYWSSVLFSMLLRSIYDMT